MAARCDAGVGEPAGEGEQLDEEQPGGGVGGAGGDGRFLERDCVREAAVGEGVVRGHAGSVRGGGGELTVRSSGPSCILVGLAFGTIRNLSLLSIRERPARRLPWPGRNRS